MDRVAVAVADKDVRYLAANPEIPSGFNFSGTAWKREVNVRDFIQHNVTPYFGDNRSWRPRPSAPTRCGPWSSS